MSTEFQEALFDIASRIAVQKGRAEIDPECLWQAFLHIAYGQTEADETMQARTALQNRFGDRQWEGGYPEDIGVGPDVKLPPSPIVKRGFAGALSILGKDFSNRLTPENFIDVLERSLREGTGRQDSREDILEIIAQPAGTLSRPLAPSDGADAIDGGPGDDHVGSLKSPGPSEVEVLRPPHGTLAEIVGVLRGRLESEVFGQTSAVRLFADGLLSSLARPTTSGRLGGSFLIFGPNGCGKGELLRVLGNWLKEFREQLPVRRLITCEGYLPNSLSTLRSQVREGGSGPAIIVLSEFEKYDPSVRDVLMEGLDRAVLYLPDRSDGGELVETSIKGSIIILLGNVGRAFWPRLPFKEQEILPDQERIREVLEAEDMADRHHGSDVFRSRIDRSFLDRIEWFIPFCQLRYADAERILRRELGTLVDEARTSGCDLRVEPSVIDLVLLASHFKRGVSGRQTIRGFRRYIESHARNSLELRPEVINIRCDEYDDFKATMTQRRPAIIVVDDEFEHGVRDTLSDSLGSDYEIAGTADVEQALGLVAERGEPFDLLLLDMHFGAERGWMWEKYLETWRQQCPDTPVVLFSQMAVSTDVRHKIDRLGGVLGFIQKGASAEELRTALQPCLEHAAWQAKIREFQSSYGFAGDRILFDVRHKRSKNGRDAVVEFDDVRLVVDESSGEQADSPILSAELEREISELVGVFLNPEQRRKLRITRPKGLLLSGPPGNGKTMTARRIAHDIRCNFLSANASDIKSKWAGVASEKIKGLFEKARRRQPCVIFIDEIDAIAPTRSDDGGGGVVRDDAAAVAALLTELDGFESGGEIFVIGATNRPESVDAAVRRKGRLDREITIGNPGIDERKALLNRGLSLVPSHEIDIEWAARETYGMSAAEILAAVQDSLLLTLRETKENKNGDNIVVEKKHLRSAIDRSRYGVVRGEGSAERESLVKNQEYTAWHEAGHAIVSMALLGEIPDRISIVPHGDHLGFIRPSEADIRNRRLTPEQCSKIIATYLAGGLVEARAFGGHDPGVLSDRRQALRMASSMVGEWGMGPLEAEVSYYLSQGGTLSGPSPADSEPPAKKHVSLPNFAQQSVVKAISEIMEKATELATREIDKRWQEIENLVTVLTQKEELDAAMIEDAIPDLVAQCRKTENEHERA